MVLKCDLEQPPEDTSKNILGISFEQRHECSYIQDKDEVKLYIPKMMYAEWLYLMKLNPQKEWGAVFDTKKEKKGKFVITNYRIPKQKRSKTECEFEEDLGGNGMVHSHHEMEAKWSTTDDESAKNLYEFSIIMTDNNGIKVVQRRKVPCGGYAYKNITLYIITEQEKDNLEEWAVEQMKKIRPLVYAPVREYNNYPSIYNQKVQGASRYYPGTAILKNQPEHNDYTACYECVEHGEQGDSSKCITCTKPKTKSKIGFEKKRNLNETNDENEELDDINGNLLQNDIDTLNLEENFNIQDIDAFDSDVLSILEAPTPDEACYHLQNNCLECPAAKKGCEFWDMMDINCPNLNANINTWNIQGCGTSECNFIKWIEEQNPTLLELWMADCKMLAAFYSQMVGFGLVKNIGTE